MKIANAALQQANQILTFYRGFSVPPYQRPYRWDETQVRLLLDDISEAVERNEQDFFLGTILLRKPANQRAEIVDGQQRLVSLFLLLAAIVEKRKSGDSDIYIDENPRTSRIILGGKNYPTDSTIKHASFIDHMLHGHGRDKQAEAIRAAFSVMTKFLANMDSSAVSSLRDFILSKIQFVEVSVNTAEDAYAAFEVMNSRSTPLTPYELIRSLSITKGEGKIVDTWRDIDKCADKLKTESQERFCSELLTDAFWIAFKYQISISPNAATRFSFASVKSYLCSQENINKLAQALGRLLNGMFELEKGDISFSIKDDLLALAQWASGARPLVCLLWMNGQGDSQSGDINPSIKKLVTTAAIHSKILRIDARRLWNDLAVELFIRSSLSVEEIYSLILKKFDAEFCKIGNERKAELLNEFCPSYLESRFILIGLEKFMGAQLPASNQIDAYRRNPDEKNPHSKLLGNWHLRSKSNSATLSNSSTAKVDYKTDVAEADSIIQRHAKLMSLLASNWIWNPRQESLRIQSAPQAKTITLK